MLGVSLCALHHRCVVDQLCVGGLAGPGVACCAAKVLRPLLSFVTVNWKIEYSEMKFNKNLLLHAKYYRSFLIFRLNGFYCAVAGKAIARHGLAPENAVGASIHRLKRVSGYGDARIWNIFSG